jgi:hypothetical protein
MTRTQAYLSRCHQARHGSADPPDACWPAEPFAEPVLATPACHSGHACLPLWARFTHEHTVHLNAAASQALQTQGCIRPQCDFTKVSLGQLEERPSAPVFRTLHGPLTTTSTVAASGLVHMHTLLQPPAASGTTMSIYSCTCSCLSTAAAAAAASWPSPPRPPWPPAPARLGTWGTRRTWPSPPAAGSARAGRTARRSPCGGAARGPGLREGPPRWLEPACMQHTAAVRCAWWSGRGTICWRAVGCWRVPRCWHGVLPQAIGVHRACTSSPGH